MAAGIYWLASYPKSGNTWTRSFLRALELPGQDIDINDLEVGAIASSRSWIEIGSGLSLEDSTVQDIELIRPLAYRFLHQRCKTAEYHKIHDAYHLNQQQQPLFPAEAACGVLYIVRHPYDVAVSLANHNQISLQKAVDAMCNSDYCFARAKGSSNVQVQQRLLNWSEHVSSWLQSPHQLQLVRYEDMQQQPQQTFSDIATFLGFTKSQDEIAAAVAACQFDKLKQHEQQHGFRERPTAAASFFRRGKVGDGRQELSAAQQQQLYQCHALMMDQLGYTR